MLPQCKIKRKQRKFCIKTKNPGGMRLRSKVLLHRPNDLFFKCFFSSPVGSVILFLSLPHFFSFASLSVPCSLFLSALKMSCCTPPFPGGAPLTSDNSSVRRETSDCLQISQGQHMNGLFSQWLAERHMDGLHLGRKSFFFFFLIYPFDRDRDSQ